MILMTPEEREAQRKRTEHVTGTKTDTQTDSARVEACNVGADDIVDNLNEAAITNLVEHPQQLRPPSEYLLSGAIYFRYGEGFDFGGLDLGSGGILTMLALTSKYTL